MATTESEVKDCMFCLREYPAKDMVKDQLDFSFLPPQLAHARTLVFHVCYECAANERDAQDPPPPTDYPGQYGDPGSEPKESRS